MTTPNEELIAELQQLANEIEISYRIESIEEAVKTLQSQAARMAVLERESETHSKAYGLAIVERDNLRTEVEAVRKANLDCVDHYNAALDEVYTLRAELAAIAATEPVYYLGGGWLYGDKTSALFDNAKNAITELFTRPMPAQLSEMEARKDAAYLERNQLVSLLSKLFPSGIKRTAIEGWSDDWHGCVYIDLPTGQASWHYHDSQAYLFAHLPPYAGEWDGHDTEQKYERIANAMPAQDVTELVEALEEYGRAGVGNSTDWRVQLSALRLASTALSKYKGAK